MKYWGIVGGVLVSATNMCCGVEFAFTLIETEPKVADSLQADLTKGGDTAVEMMEKLEGLTKQGTVKQLGAVTIETESGKRAKGSEGGESIQITEKWKAREGLNIELDSTVASDNSKIDLNIAANYYANGRGKNRGKLAVLEIVLARIGVPRVPGLVFRSDRDGAARLLLCVPKVKGRSAGRLYPEGTAMSKLTARVFEFRSNGERDKFLAETKKTDSQSVLKALRESSKLKYQATCETLSGQRWKLKDLSNRKVTGDDVADNGITLMADQTVRKNRAKTRIDGTFEYIDKAQGISVKCEFDKTLSPVNSALVKCEGNRPCVLVLQAQATGKVDPNKGNSANDDPFG